MRQLILSKVARDGGSPMVREWREGGRLRMSGKRRLLKESQRKRAETGSRCDTCGERCADELALLKHRESKHLQRACAYCPASFLLICRGLAAKEELRFGTIEDLMGHYKTEHKDGDPRKDKKPLILTSSHCKFCSQMHDSRTMYKFDWERREIVKCRCCNMCDRDKRVVERNPGPGQGAQGINWNRQEPGVKYKCYLCEVSFDHPLVARSHFTRCHGFPKDIELVAHSTEIDPQEDPEGEEEEEMIAVTEEEEPVRESRSPEGPPAKVFASDYRNSLFVSVNSRPRKSSSGTSQLVEYEIREPGENLGLALGERDDSHRYEFEEDGHEYTVQLLPQEYAEEVTVVADF